MKNFKLENESKITSGFNVPENYFDTFESKINAKLNTPEPKVVSIFSKQKTWIYTIAASLVVMISIPFVNHFLEKNNSENQLSVEDYIAYNTSITEDDLVDAMEQEDVEQMKVEYNIQDEAIEETLIKNNDLEDYLIN